VADSPRKNKIQTPPGMKDILPDEVALYRLMEDTARSIFERCGYAEIRTPVLEQTELFARGIGETTDIVEKEMFTLVDEGLTLRPEGTASVVRSYVEHSLHKEKSFRKLFYAGPFFRRERPQKGRLRQFHQIGLEAIGADDPLLDAECIIAAVSFLEALGVSGWKLKLNSIGCEECRGGYRDVLKEALADKMAALCENCRNRFDRNVFRILDCKKESCRAVAAGAPTFRDRLCEPCADHMTQVESALEGAGIEFVSDPHLVRGFDYYTRTVFEVSHDGLGAQDAILAGGRYDGLVEELGGPAMPGVGFSAGCERIALLLQKTDAVPAEDGGPRVYVVFVRKEQRPDAFLLVSTLRRDGVAADMNYEGRSVKAQMRAAERSGCTHVAILGPDEVEKGIVKLKNMQTGNESEVAPADIANHLTN